MDTLSRRQVLQAVSATALAAGCSGAESSSEPRPKPQVPYVDPLLADVGAQPPFEIVSVGGHSIAVARRGRGRPVVCLHAIAHGARDFELLAERLSNSCEIVAVDFPGHGHSPPDGGPVRIAHYADVVSEVIRELRLDRPVLLGNSVGGGVAIDIASRAPNAVSGLVLCDSAGLVPGSPLVAMVVEQQIEFFKRGAAGDPSFASEFASFYGTVLPGPSARPQRERIVAAAYQSAPLLVDAWTGFLEPSAFLGDLVAAITTPTWLAWAENDAVLPWDFCKATAETFPNHSLDFFEGGHSPFLEDPDAFAAGLERFLAMSA